MIYPNEDLDALKARGVIRDYSVIDSENKQWNTQTLTLVLHDGTVLEIEASGSPSEGGFHDSPADGILSVGVELFAVNGEASATANLIEWKEK